MQNWVEQRRSLDGQRFDVAVIGGGVNGVAVARACAAGGRRTLLVEQNDFASGTTSRSTRIIHGGLRYLEHGEIGVVRESLRERERLLRERGHLVRPLQFLLALGPGRHNALLVRFALSLYRRWARGDTKRKPGAETQELERLLDRGGNTRAWNIFSYDDAQCEFPERLVAEWLTEAIAAGAEVRNYAEAVQVEIAHGRVTGLRLRDRLSGEQFRVSARWIINATGPWADTICRKSGVVTSEPMISGVRGSHLVLPRFPGAPHNAVYAEAVDRRPIFLIPWNEQILLGTTEVADGDDPAQARPTRAEAEYLMRSFQRLFPAAGLGWSDVRYSFAGVRALPYAAGQPASAISRRASLRDHTAEGAAGMISIIGGKLTTAASLARQCARKIGIVAPEPALIGVESADQMQTTLEASVRLVQQAGKFSEKTARALVAWHGTNALDIAAAAGADERLRAPLCDHSAHIVAEAVHAHIQECAVTLADILLRRVPVALSECWSTKCMALAGIRIGLALGWSRQRVAAEIEAFEEEEARFLVKPALQMQPAA